MFQGHCEVISYDIIKTPSKQILSHLLNLLKRSYIFFLHTDKSQHVRNRT